MVRRLILAIVVSCAVLPGPCLAADAEFDRMDTDKDGKVTREEFLRWYPVEVWKKVDGKGKGYIEETEWIPVRESLAQYRRQQARDAEAQQ